MFNMKKLFYILALAVTAAFWAGAPFVMGCKSPTLTTTRVAGTTTITVDAAMQSWGEYVRSGRASVSDRLKVREAYEKYQAAMRVAESVAVSVLAAPEKQNAYQTALGAAAAASVEVLALIETLIPK